MNTVNMSSGIIIIILCSLSHTSLLYFCSYIGGSGNSDVTDPVRTCKEFRRVGGAPIRSYIMGALKSYVARRLGLTFPSVIDSHVEQRSRGLGASEIAIHSLFFDSWYCT